MNERYVLGMRLRLGELRVLLHEAYDEGDTVWLDGKDLSNCLVSSHKDVAERQGVSVYVPFKYNPDPPPSVEKLGLTSKQALATLKRPVPLGNNRKLKATNKAHDAVVERMAQYISANARKSYGGDIDYVVHAASSSHVAEWLATLVGSHLDAPVVSDAFIKKQGSEVDLNLARFQDWASKNPNIAPTVMLAIEKTLNTYKRTGKIVASKETNVYWRRFFNNHKPGPGMGALRGKKVLVIDDNVDSGWTFWGMHELLVQAGVDPYDIKYAAGFDYAERAAKK